MKCNLIPSFFLDMMTAQIHSAITILKLSPYFNHSWTPPFLLEKGDKPEKGRKGVGEGGGGVTIEMGGCHFFYYFAVQSHLL